jgi:hypothetical protein
MLGFSSDAAIDAIDAMSRRSIVVMFMLDERFGGKLRFHIKDELLAFTVVSEATAAGSVRFPTYEEEHAALLRAERNKRKAERKRRK